MKTLRCLLGIMAIQWLISLPVAQALTCNDSTIPPSNPDSFYIDHGDGTVSDTRTVLMWDQCYRGQVGSACSGDAISTYQWAAALGVAVSANIANYKGYNDWRLPNVKELRSLVEQCRSSPAINDKFFPASLGEDFWSSSPSASFSGNAWYVSFTAVNYYGSNVTDGNGHYSKRVRLVRGGQSFASFDAQSTSSTYTLTVNSSSAASDTAAGPELPLGRSARSTRNTKPCSVVSPIRL